MPSVAKVVASIKSAPMTKRAAPVAKSTIQKFGVQLMEDVGATDPFNLSSKRVQHYMANFAAKKIADVTKTTQARVAKTMTRAVDEGKTTEQIAKLLTDQFDQWSTGRAMTVARTEVGAASNFGAFEGMQQAGIEQKEWLATDDDAVRETHQELDGEVVGIDEPFEIEGLEADYPGDFGDPAEDTNCRCSVLPVVADKSVRHRWSMRATERERKPFDKKMYTAVSKAFLDQKAAALSALGA